MPIKLYCFGESGNSYKAALTLQIAGLEWEAVFVDFFNGEARSEAYRANVNAMGEVPVLVNGDQHLSQSGAIQQFICQKYSPNLGGHEDDHFEVLRWVLWDNHKFSSYAGVTRFLMNFVPEDKRPSSVISFLQGRLKGSYATLDNHLQDRDWIVGAEPTVADLSCCGYLFYPEPFGFERTEWKNIDGWLSRIQKLPNWVAPYELMPGHPSDRA